MPGVQGIDQRRLVDDAPTRNRDHDRARGHGREFLRTQQRDAIADPRKQNTFKTKHLNTWVAAASPWLNLHRLQLAGNPDITLESMRGKPCVVGLDLASKVDVASCVFLFREEIDVTSHDSTAKEYLMGLKDYGDCTFPINWIPGNAIHKALWDAAEDDEPTNFQIKDDPTTPTMTLAFAALVKTQPTMDFPIDAAVTAEVTLRVTGDVLMTVTGSGS